VNVSSDSTASLFRRHIEMLVLAGAIVVLAFLLEVHPDQRVAFSLWPAWPLPETCPSRSLFRVDCPGCGLTRSFVHLAHGDLGASWCTHRVGWLMSLAVVLQFPYRIIALRSHTGAPFGTLAPKLVGWILILLLIVNWLMNIVARFHA
jgi:hypothetical protein